MKNILDFSNFINEKYNKDLEFSVGDIVLIRYWLTGDIVPVKIIEKKTHSYFIVSHKVEGSNLVNVKDHGIKKNSILGMYKGISEPVDPQETMNPNIRPNISGIVPGWNSWNNDINVSIISY
jgi:hypothetical protein